MRALTSPYSTEEFRQKLINVHGNSKYDFSKIEYTLYDCPILIGCNNCGFWHNRRSSTALKLKNVCPICEGVTYIMDTDLFLYKYRWRFPNSELNFDKFEYKGNAIKGTIVCRKHGEHQMTPNALLNGKGCPKCSKELTPLKRRVPELEVQNRLPKGINLIKDTYISNRKFAEFICDNGHRFKGIAPYVTRCSQCEALKPMHNNLPNTISFNESSFVGISKPIEFSCNLCGDTWKRSNGYGTIRCPSCFPRMGLLGYTIAERNKKELLLEPAFVYVVKLKNKTESFYKVGFTIQSVEERAKYFVGYTSKTILSYCTNSYEALYIEKALKWKFKESKYIPKIEFGGYTECFTENPAWFLRDIIKARINLTKG